MSWAYHSRNRRRGLKVLVREVVLWSASRLGPAQGGNQDRLRTIGELAGDRFGTRLSAAQ